MSNLYSPPAERPSIDGNDQGLLEAVARGEARLTADQAFQFLIRTSQTSNRKLNDIADQLARTGQLPAAEPAPATVHDLAAAS